MSSSIASFTSSAPLFGPNVVSDRHHYPPTTVKFRPLRISASASPATSAPEMTIPHISSPSSSLYEVLGIQMGATCQEIKTAYRRLVRVLHPDVAATGQRDTCAARFVTVHEAYATLSDPEKRADYDRVLFRRRRPRSSYYTMSASVSAAMMRSSATGSRGYTRRSWETDQCW